MKSPLKNSSASTIKPIRQPLRQASITEMSQIHAKLELQRQNIVSRELKNVQARALQIQKINSQQKLKSDADRELQRILYENDKKKMQQMDQLYKQQQLELQTRLEQEKLFKIENERKQLEDMRKRVNMRKIDAHIHQYKQKLLKLNFLSDNLKNVVPKIKQDISLQKITLELKNEQNQSNEAISSQIRFAPPQPPIPDPQIIPKPQIQIPQMQTHQKLLLSELQQPNPKPNTKRRKSSNVSHFVLLAQTQITLQLNKLNNVALLYLKNELKLNLKSCEQCKQDISGYLDQKLTENLEIGKKHTGDYLEVQNLLNLLKSLVNQIENAEDIKWLVNRIDEI
ncbi:Hypothetical_protein [Hexamita inflata]|uniref:Hypothetical_protein n=1 Tax=Hexamita inflata TaxID=28002 RepID=A0AA86QN99_9EUKA|nr:Hypothetical protein HINF_LOCUS49033 [Hexamita inflata]